MRRRFDQLDIARLRMAANTRHVLGNGDMERWPFLAIYALSDATLAPGPAARLDLAAGECFIRGNRAPFVASALQSSEVLAVQLPAESVRLYRRALEQADGCKCATSHGTGRLVGQILSTIAADLDGYRPANPAHLAHHLVGLLALMWAETVPPEVGWSRSKMLERAKEYIELHLDDFELTPASIAAAQNMSLRNVHRLFESEDFTISGWIRHRRLERARIDLTDRALEDLSIGRIAARWGLGDPAHFSRIFKTTYGISPSALRLSSGSPVMGESAVIRERVIAA